MSAVGTHGGEAFAFRGLPVQPTEAPPETPPIASITTKKEPDYVRLPNGQPLLRGLEKLMTDNDITITGKGTPDYSRVEEITVKYWSEKGGYTDNLKDVKARIYISDKWPTFGKECFCFEQQWELKIEGRDQPLKLRNTIFTNVVVPKKGDADRHERAKNRALSMAFVTEKLISSAMDPKNSFHAETEELRDNLRSHASFKVMYAGEGKNDFRKQNYLDRPLFHIGEHAIHWSRHPLFFGVKDANDAVVTIEIGEGPNVQTKKIDLNKMVRVNDVGHRIINEAQRLKTATTVTPNMAVFEEIRRLELLKKEDILNLDRDRLNQLNISDKTLRNFAEDRADQNTEKLSRLLSSYKPTSNKGPMEKLQTKLSRLAEANEITPKEWNDITIEASKFDTGYDQVNKLLADIDRDVTLLRKLNDDFNVKTPAYKTRKFARALENGRHEYEAMGPKVESLRALYFRAQERYRQIGGEATLGFEEV